MSRASASWLLALAMACLAFPALADGDREHTTEEADTSAPPEQPVTEEASPDEAPSDGLEAVSPEEMEAIMRALELDRQQDEPPGDPAEGRAETAPRPRASPSASMNPDISFIFNSTFAIFSGEPRQTGAHDPTETGFNFQQLEMAVSSAVDPYFRFDTFIVFSLFGVEIEEAYGTTLSLPLSLQARLGQFLTRVGRVNPSHPHDWPFEDQPLVLGKFFGGENNRGLGLELSWLAPLPWYVETIWSITDGRGASTARSFWGSEPLAIRSPLDFQNLLAVRQFFPLSDDLSLLVGLTGMTGANPTGPNNRTDIFAADFYLRWRPISRASCSRHVTVQAEAWTRRRQIPIELLVDYGGYAQAVWRFALRWETGARFELVTGMENDPLDPQWTGSRTRNSAMLTFRPTEFSRLRLQAARDDAAPIAVPTYYVFLSAELGIGAHAAHPF